MAYIPGTEFNDTLNGTDGDDTIDGSGGDDFIRGGGGDDSLLGGDGNDTLSATLGGSDTLHGEAGDDLLRTSGNNSDDLLDGGAGNDTLAIDASLTGGTLIGGSGTDLLEMRGGGGQDLRGTVISGIERTELWQAVSFSIDAAQAVNLGEIVMAEYALTNGSGLRLHAVDGQAAVVTPVLSGTQRLAVFSTDSLASEMLSVDFSGGTYADDSYAAFYGGAGDEAVIGGSGNDDFRGGGGDDSLLGGDGN
ncbi:calcium-binding protein, partial [Ruegeria aquimaris]|nr:hypothetical protein [Ruegeria sp. XHP0148]